MLEKSRIEDFVKNEENFRGNVGGNSMLEEIQWSRLQVIEEEEDL